MGTMGRVTPRQVTPRQVKPRQVKESEREGSIAKAIQGYSIGKYPNIRQAAESQGLPYTTLQGGLQGRKASHIAHELEQRLGEAEERSVVKQIEDMDRRGFPMRVDSVRETGLKVLLEREGPDDRTVQ